MVQKEHGFGFSVFILYKFYPKLFFFFFKKEILFKADSTEHLFLKFYVLTYAYYFNKLF